MDSSVLYGAACQFHGSIDVVSSPEVTFPIAVRYAWVDNPICNLYNGINLSASSCRTDDWHGIIYGNK